MIIREANKEDNQSLLEFPRQNPMESSLSIYADRSPDYFYLPSLQDYNPKVLVAEREEQIVEVTGYSFRNVFLFGRPIKIGYIGGLKISESAKGSSALFRLMKKLTRK
jgi:hypothetical protein